MRAAAGDWLIVEGRAVGGVIRHGLIEEVRGKDGAPPYLVHWVDTGARALVFPGPDAHVIGSAELHAREEIAAARWSSPGLTVRPGDRGRLPRDVVGAGGSMPALTVTGRTDSNPSMGESNRLAGQQEQEPGAR
ncbi:DUF1918 domain-containing protein [Nocardia sp. NPDC127526]|uniref:DUF1918 domain-containing protein n=1 Tax=Nocardia sp. NPDC127526 TaxID=3345393 RepID=UPI0036331ECA